MTLLADYQARFSLQLRTGWSNPQLSGATSPDATHEALAAADAQADFEVICGVVYSSSNTVHVAAACPLVAAKLQVYTGHADESYYTAALDRCTKYYRLVLGRNRIQPTTDSLLTPTTDTPGAKPDFDRGQFSRYTGNPPNQTPNQGSNT